MYGYGKQKILGVRETKKLRYIGSKKLSDNESKTLRDKGNKKSLDIM